MTDTEHPAVMLERLLQEKHNFILENEKLRSIIDRLLTAGNHIATYKTDAWPDYQLDGLSRDQQCRSALWILGATRQYDMWCCWSEMMQARDELEQEPSPKCNYCFIPHNGLTRCNSLEEAKAW